MHTSMSMKCALVFPSLGLCVRYATTHGLVVDKQCGYETFIVPALNINNIAVFMFT